MKIITRSIITGFFVAVLYLPGIAAAGGVVATVDIKKIINESLATKSIRNQVMDRRSKYQEEVTKKEDELRKEDEELAKQRTILSKEAFEKKVKEFQKRVMGVQRDVQARGSKLDSAYATAMSEVQKAIVSVISKLSNNKGFSVALPKSQVLFAKDALDISSEVLVELDKILPDIGVKFDEG